MLLHTKLQREYEADQVRQVIQYTLTDLVLPLDGESQPQTDRIGADEHVGAVALTVWVSETFNLCLG